MATDALTAADKPKRRWRIAKVSLAALLLFLLTALIVGQLVRHRTAFASFKDLAIADRIVVRDGGFDCCGPVDDDVVLFEVTAPSEIKAVLDNLDYTGTRKPCLCCGFPGIDWYCGKKRIALMAVQHGGAIRWGRGEDMILSEKASAWLRHWLVAHGVPEKDIEHGCGGPRKHLRRELAKVRAAQGFVERGNACAEQGDGKNAIANFSKAIDLVTYYALAYYYRALAHEGNGDIGAALEDYTNAIWFNPRERQADDEAENPLATEVREATQLGEHLAKAYFQRGLAHEKKGDKEEAKKDFTKAKGLGFAPK